MFRAFVNFKLLLSTYLDSPFDLPLKTYPVRGKEYARVGFLTAPYSCVGTAAGTPPPFSEKQKESLRGNWHEGANLEGEHKITYSLEDLIKENWKQSHQLLGQFEKALKKLGKFHRKVNKFYLTYSLSGERSAVEIVPQRQALKVYLRPKKRCLKSQSLELISCEHIGHWTNGNTFFLVSKSSEIPAAVDLVEQAIEVSKKGK